MLAVDRFTTFGVVWEGACRLPIQWSAECSRVFAACGIPAPPPAASLEDAEAAEALAAEAAGQAVRSQTIKAYKSMVSLRKKPSVFSLLRRQGCSLAPAGEAPRPADDGHQCEQEETTTEEKAEKERVEPAAVVEKEVGRGTEKAGEQEGEKETNGQDETQQLLGAAEAPGLVGEEISRRLSKPAEAMQGAEDNAQNSEEEKPQAHAERKTERAGDGKEAEKTRHDAASAEAEAAQATSQESPGGPPESKNSTRASPTAAPVEKKILRRESQPRRGRREIRESTRAGDVGRLSGSDRVQETEGDNDRGRPEGVDHRREPSSLPVFPKKVWISRDGRKRLVRNFSSSLPVKQCV
ncbi:CRAL/TRIO domain-containing protein [Toxoplasma gondii p89]|uniref:CRAL/TRIO domain-containing protein n=1 Tax=Toxoplasma gondii p89 TaxID=943119 RepID=A0A086KQX5_TOXGO|nr:CRAL/TRIO domain-containing protein [Toxoplasma gondii p89]